MTPKSLKVSNVDMWGLGGAGDGGSEARKADSVEGKERELLLHSLLRISRFRLCRAWGPVGHLEEELKMWSQS